MAAQILEIMPGATSATTAEMEGTPTPPAAASSLVPLRSGGSMAPLFCIHPSGGMVNIYENLAKQLPPELPVYGLQSRALFGAGTEHATVAAMAEHYAGLIQEKHPRGPLRLLGFSLGGLMAMEIARVIEDAGRTVAFVGLIDADLRWTERENLKQEFFRRNIFEMYGTFTRELGFLKPLAPPELEKFAGQIAEEIVEAPPEMRAAVALRFISEHGDLLPGLPVELVKQYLSLFFLHTNFLGECSPTLIRAPLAAWAGRQTRDEVSAWRNYTSGEFSEASIDGDHYDLMYPPFVHSLATQLTAALTRPRRQRAVEEPVLIPA
jgi:thioesterase domain-containing protein